MDEETKKHFEALAEEDYWEYRRANPRVSEGEAALEATLIYDSYLLPPPSFAIEEIKSCWRLYKDGRKEMAYFVEPNMATPSEAINVCVSLGEAFGIERPPSKEDKRRALSLADGTRRSFTATGATIRRREVYLAVKNLLATGKYSRSMDGARSAFCYVADKLNIGVSTVAGDYYEFEKELEEKKHR